MPAVSTKRHVLPPSSTSSSTGSRVVPATSSTTTRSSPASLLSRLDLPTFGRPSSATRRGPPRGVGAADRGDLGQHVEDGVEQVAAAPAVQRGDRVRLAEPEGPQHRGVGLGARRRRPCWRRGRPACRSGAAARTTASSVSVAPTVASTTNSTTSARSTAISACSATRRWMPLGVALPAAGVDEGEPAAGPLGVVRDAVAGDAGDVLDDGLAAADDAVDQRRLADVRAADDGQHRQRAGLLLAVDTLGGALEQRAVVVVELELLQPDAQGVLDRGVVALDGVDGLGVLAHGRVLRQVGGGAGSTSIVSHFRWCLVRAQCRPGRSVTRPGRSGTRPGRSGAVRVRRGPARCAWPPRRARPAPTARGRGGRCRPCRRPAPPA